MHAIDQLIETHSRMGSQGASALFRAIRALYADDEELKAATPHSDEQVLQKMASLPGVSAGAELSLTALRAELNDALIELYLQGDNPGAVSINSKYAIILQSPASLKTSGSEPRRAFKSSEISFNLPTELQSQFEKQIDTLKNEQQKTNEKMRALLEREAQLEEEKQSLEQETQALRSRYLEQVETLQKNFEVEKRLAEEEMERLKKDVARANEDIQTFQERQTKDLQNYQESSSQLEGNFSRHEIAFQSKFDEMTRLMKRITEDEAKANEKSKSAQARLVARENQIAEAVASARKQLKDISAQFRAVQSDRKKLRERYSKEIEKTKSELERDFSRRSEYHFRRLEEWEDEEDRLNRENESLRIREQSLALEIKGKTDEQFKKRQLELDNLEKQLSKRQKEVLKQERELERDKEGLKLLLKKVRGGKFGPQQIENLFKDQEKVTRRKSKLLKSFETEQAAVRTEFNRKVAELESEKKEAFGKLENAHNSINNEKERLLKMEARLLEREGKELKRLNQEYEELRNSFEVEKIEKEMEMDQQEDALFKDQESLYERQEKILEQEETTAQRIRASEEKIQEMLDEVQDYKQSSLSHQGEVDAFLKDFQKSYEMILESQKESYALFQEKIADAEATARRIASNLQDQEQQSREHSVASEQAFKEKFQQKEQLAEMLEKDLRNKMNEYKSYMKELTLAKENMLEKEESQQREYMESVSQYEDKLLHLGQAFEELSEAFHHEKEKGRIEIKPEDKEDDRKPLEYDTALAKAEWPHAVRDRLGANDAEETPPKVEEYIYKLAEQWTQWTEVPPGTFWMGSKQARAQNPYRETSIPRPLKIMKYPVTNVEFFHFVAETNYKTEAEGSIAAVVLKRNNGNNGYGNATLTEDRSAFWLKPNGSPEALYAKYHHPVTQVTWNDALAYCRWKSEALEKTVRLPTEEEWEYVARNFGQIPSDEFYWELEKASRFCNIEESGIGDTTAVDHFQETDPIGGSFDLFGNVFEWTADTDASRSRSLTYKLARGGSFLTTFSQIAPWRHSAFAMNYGAAFLGFRAVIED